jgi:hypothetical protein
VLGLSLDLIVHAVGVIWPVERETVADKPLTKVSAVHGASRESAPVLIQRDWRAANRLTRDVGVKIIRCLRAASILEAVATKSSATAWYGEPYTQSIPSRAGQIGQRFLAYFSCWVSVSLPNCSSVANGGKADVAPTPYFGGD